MSGEYVPTTEHIRDYVEMGGEPRPWEPPTPEGEALEVKRREAFDRWLETVKADAWDEVADNLGEYAEVDDSLIHLADNIRDANPYRKQEEA